MNKIWVEVFNSFNATVTKFNLFEQKTRVYFKLLMKFSGSVTWNQKNAAGVFVWCELSTLSLFLYFRRVQKPKMNDVGENFKIFMWNRWNELSFGKFELHNGDEVWIKAKIGFLFVSLSEMLLIHFILIKLQAVSRGIMIVISTQIYKQKFV